MLGWRKKGDDGANKRTEARVAVDGAKVQVGSDECDVVEWSANGFSARPCPEWIEEGKEISIDFQVTIDNGEFDFTCQALIVRCNADRSEFAAMFVFIPQDARATIDRYFGVF
jgi:hypothetical protein